MVWYRGICVNKRFSSSCLSICSALLGVSDHHVCAAVTLASLSVLSVLVYIPCQWGGLGFAIMVHTAMIMIMITSTSHQ